MSTHLGEEKVLEQLMERLYWLGYTKIIVHHMLHTEISCPKAEGGSANNPG